MTSRFRLHPTNTDRAALAKKATNDGADSALTCVRRILADAEQICTDAADIEDARFIAENIADTCRRALADGSATMPLSPMSHPAKGNLTLADPPPERFNRARKAAAREKLGSLTSPKDGPPPTSPWCCPAAARPSTITAPASCRSSG
jgi:hypothetical protein